MTREFQGPWNYQSYRVVGDAVPWQEVIGRVPFINCDPIFHGLDSKWDILPAPPSWLSGHLIRKDCLTAPIPSADYATHKDELVLLPNLGIVSRGNVGSVILFGSRPIESMRDIALPSDSSTSKKLLGWILEDRGLDPKTVEMGPNLTTMLECCDGALMIGDRALSAVSEYPNFVQMDLGAEWTRITGTPMVFGIFAKRKDAPLESARNARDDMLRQCEMFEQDERWRNEVIKSSSESSGIPKSRVSQYFDNEVENRLDQDSIDGLEMFLREACGMPGEIEWAWMD